MKTIIKGRKYNFYVVSDGIEFYIKALHRISSRASFINNVNAILSEFNIDINDKKSAESQWLISEKLSGQFFKRAKSFLSDKNYRDYIEKRLDEDRECGEWENPQKS
ncbi:hypothetical protein COS16_08650 [Candidatus Desantisbacteria bacterium CG02_land_8_20_14_3_00_49_13]|nr:MAG: hypothetical protein AUJ67_08270 [Candidatus Desantisbacteria bacterium CG1_02_49_89]PIV54996.1 MAG: hypothetical protein COS16_08650 [Candidatus Desantisbacteria bacterium CG02_land_8_20_14_3_00_49_13]